MLNFNPTLIPTIAPGLIFDKFLSDETIQVRWMTAKDPVFFEAINRPIADLAMRQLILAKAVDNLENLSSAAALFPFVIQPKLVQGSTSTAIPTQLIFDMNISIPTGWYNLRLIRVDRLDGVNDASGYTGTLRFIFGAEDGVGTDAVLNALFYADYLIDSPLGYQIEDVALADEDTAPGLFIPESVSVSGKIIFRTGDQSNAQITTFYNFARPDSVVYKYFLVNTDGSEEPNFSAGDLPYGTGLLTAKAYNEGTGFGIGGGGSGSGGTGGTGAFGGITPGSDKMDISFDAATGVYVIDILPGNIDHNDLFGVGSNTHAQIDSHIANLDNPHQVTAAQVGSDTAQWNASAIQGADVNADAPSIGDILQYSGTEYVAQRMDPNYISITLSDGSQTTLQYAITNGLIGGGNIGAAIKSQALTTPIVGTLLPSDTGPSKDFTYTVADLTSAGLTIGALDDVIGFYVDIDFQTLANSLDCLCYYHDGTDYAVAFRTRVGTASANNDQHRVTVFIPRLETAQLRMRLDATSQTNFTQLQFTIKAAVKRIGLNAEDHEHDDRYYTKDEVDSLAGLTQTVNNGILTISTLFGYFEFDIDTDVTTYLIDAHVKRTAGDDYNATMIYMSYDVATSTLSWSSNLYIGGTVTDPSMVGSVVIPTSGATRAQIAAQRPSQPAVSGIRLHADVSKPSSSVVRITFGYFVGTQSGTGTTAGSTTGQSGTASGCFRVIGLS